MITLFVNEIFRDVAARVKGRTTRPYTLAISFDLINECSTERGKNKNTSVSFVIDVKRRIA